MGVGHKLTVDMPCYMFGEGKKGLVLIRQSMRHILIRDRAAVQSTLGVLFVAG